MDFLKVMVFVFLMKTVMCHECVRVVNHLDCQGARFITNFNQDVDTIVFSDSLVASEYKRFADRLDGVQVVIWGLQNCLTICQVRTDTWMDNCLCQVCFTLISSIQS